MSNLKQIALAVTAYVSDYDETLPNATFGGYGARNPDTTATGTSGFTYYWTDAIFPYVKTEQAFVCPSEVTTGSFQYIYEFGPSYVSANGKYKVGSYAGNASFTDQNPATGLVGPLNYTSYNGIPARTMSKIASPDKLIFCADGASVYPTAPNNYSSLAIFSPSVAGTGCRAGSTTVPPCLIEFTDGRFPMLFWNKSGLTVNQPQVALMGRHTGLINIAFCDGHAKAMPPIQLAGTLGPNLYPVYLTIAGG